MNLYEISPATLGHFDLVFMGNVLLHLRNPQAALHPIRGGMRGEFVSFETISRIDVIRARPQSPEADIFLTAPP